MTTKRKYDYDSKGKNHTIVALRDRRQPLRVYFRVGCLSKSLVKSIFRHIVHDDGQILAVDDEIDHGHNARMPQTQQDCAFSHKPVDDGVVLQVLRPQELGRQIGRAHV